LPKPQLRLAADFGASPLWTSEGNIRIEDLALSPRLSTELHRWAAEFDATTPRCDSAPWSGGVWGDGAAS
jgi:hypothetical protein